MFLFEGQLYIFMSALPFGYNLYNMYIHVVNLFMSSTIIYFHVYIILDVPITYRNALVLCQSECACLHKTVNVVEPKRRALMHMYRVVPITQSELYIRINRHEVKCIVHISYQEISKHLS